MRLETRKTPQGLVVVNYSGVLRSNLFVEALVSKRHFTFEGTGATSTDLIDGTLMGVARGVEELSQGLRTLQTGLVRNYALAIALGMVLIVGIYFAAFSSLFR